jgi:hypothetical protein
VSSTKFTRQVFKWLAQVNADPELPANAIKVAVRLAPDFNEEHGGMAWPGLQTVADDIGLKSKVTIHNMIRRLQERGHLRIEWGRQGKGHSNHYWMILKGQQGDLFDPAKSSTQDELSGGAKSSTQDELSENAKVHFSGVKSSFSAAKSSSQDEQTHRDSSKTHRKKHSPDDDAFEEWWRHYPKKVAKGAAHKAYQQIIRKGTATEAELLNGVMRYAAERTGKDEHYTKYPAGWLSAERWKDAPAASPPRQQGFLDSIDRGLKMVGGDDEVSP